MDLDGVGQQGSHCHSSGCASQVFLKLSSRGILQIWVSCVCHCLFPFWLGMHWINQFNVFAARLPFVDITLSVVSSFRSNLLPGSPKSAAAKNKHFVQVEALAGLVVWLNLQSLGSFLRYVKEIFGKASQCLNIKEFHLRSSSSSDESFSLASTSWTWQCLLYCFVFQGFSHPDEVLAASQKCLLGLCLVSWTDGWSVCWDIYPVLTALVLECVPWQWSWYQKSHLTANFAVKQENIATGGRIWRQKNHPGCLTQKQEVWGKMAESRGEDGAHAIKLYLHFRYQ